MTDFPDVKLKALVSFPASVRGGTGIDVNQNGGTYTLDLDYSELAPIASVSLATTFLALWEQTQDTYGRISVLDFSAATGFISVKNFGAIGNGVNDDTVAIQAAINAAQNASGGLIYFPPGTYKITGTLTITSNGIRLLGADWRSVTLNFANGSFDCITVQGVSFASQLYGFQLENFLFTFTSKTGGRTLLLANVAQTIVQNVSISNCWTGIEIWNANSTYLQNVILQGITGGASVPAFQGSFSPGACYGLYWHSPGDNSARSDVLTVLNTTVNCQNSGADGFIWDGLANTLNVFQLTLLQCRYGMRVLNSAASVNFFPAFAQFDNFNTENCTKGGVRIEAGRSYSFNNCFLYNSSGNAIVGSGDDYAVEALADAAGSITSNLLFTNSNIGHSTKSALWCAARDVQISNCNFTPGAGATSNTFTAIRVAAPAQDVTIIGNKILEWGGSIKWQYGVQTEAGTARVLVANNNFRSAVTRSIAWANTDQGSASYNNTSDLPPRPVAVGLTASSGMTLTGIQMLAPVLNLGGTPGAFTCNTPTAAQIVAACQNPYFAACITVPVINSSNGLCTFAAGAGVTFTGNPFTLAAGAQRVFTVVLTNPTIGSETVAIYG